MLFLVGVILSIDFFGGRGCFSFFRGLLREFSEVMFVESRDRRSRRFRVFFVWFRSG